MLPGAFGPRWAVDLIDVLRQNHRLDLRVALFPSHGVPAARQPASHRLFSALTWVNRLIAGGSTDPFATVTVTDHLSGVACIGRPQKGCEAAHHSTRLDTDVIEALTSFRLDVIVWLIDGEPPARLSNMARYGVWSIPSAVRATQSNGIRLARDVDRAGTLAFIGLYATSGGDHRAIPVEQAVIGTPWGSWDRVRAEVVRRASAMVQRRLLAVQALDAGGLIPATAIGRARDRRQTNGTSPRRDGGEAIAAVARKAPATVIRRVEGRLYRGQEWFVAFGVRRHGEDGLELPPTLTPVLPPPGHEYADPFPVSWEGRTYLFVEDISHTAGKAIISMLEFDKAGHIGRPRPVLDAPFHLSYPFVFEADGKLYLIPESRKAGRIDLYTPREDLAEWEHVACIMADVQAADSTLVKWGEKLWLFCAMPAPGSDAACDELHLFFSSSLTAGWTPHPLNPVVTDVRRARPAGTPFLHNGQLIRPGQDCSRRYGGSIVFSRVEVLDEERYCEAPIARIGPDWAPGVTATHTYNRVGDIIVVDGKWWWRAAGRRQAVAVGL